MEHKQQIYGFEYLADQNIFYFVYGDQQYCDFSGRVPTYFAYATPSFSGGTTNISPIIENDDFAFSDLELDNNKDLLMVKSGNIVPGSGSNGLLAYIPTNGVSATALESSTSPLSPSVVSYSSSCGLSNIELNNQQYIEAFLLGYYLPNQIRGEDYRSWNADVIKTYYVTGNEVWTPANNPVANATGVPASTISFAGGIVIYPGGSLTLKEGLTLNMAPLSQINMYNWAGTIGSRLTVNDATLTVYSGPCATGPLWGGIQLWGNSTQPQGPRTTAWTTSEEPGVKLTPGATIEYANIGVHLGTLTDVTQSGGILLADGATFADNAWGVLFEPYDISNISSVSSSFATRMILNRLR